MQYLHRSKNKPKTAPPTRGQVVRATRREHDISLEALATSASVQPRLLEMFELGLHEPEGRWIAHVERVVTRMVNDVQAQALEGGTAR